MIRPRAPEQLDRFHAENALLEAFRHLHFRREMNGFTLFGGALGLCGPDLPSQPLQVWRVCDVITTSDGQGDLHRRFAGIIFGGAEHGQTSARLMESRSGEIVPVDRETSQETVRWPDFDTFRSAALQEPAANWSDEERRVNRLSFLHHKM